MELNKVVNKETLDSFVKFKDLGVYDKVNLIIVWIIERKDSKYEEYYKAFNKCLLNKGVREYWMYTFSNKTTRDGFRNILFKFEFMMFTEDSGALQAMELSFDNQDPKTLMRQTLLKQMEVNNNKITCDISNDDLKDIMDSNKLLFEEIYKLNNNSRNEF